MSSMLRFVLGLLVACFVLTLSGPSCKHEPLPYVPDPGDTTGNPIDTVGVPCDPDTVYFENHILPLLVSHCSKSGCHNEADHQDGVILTSYENVLSTVEGVSNQNWDDNKLMEVLFLNDPSDRMPPAPNLKLTFAEVDLIAKWIAQGTQNNACSESLGGCQTTDVKYSTFVKPLLETRCLGCHSGAAPFGGVDFSSYNGAKAVALNGKLYGAITRATNWMPNNGPKLSDCNIDKIKAWVDAGAPDN